MKINPNFKIREVAGEAIIVSQGIAEVNLTRIISLNDSARLLFERLYGREFTLDDAANVLIGTYGIDNELAVKDAGKWVSDLKKCSVIEE